MIKFDLNIVVYSNLTALFIHTQTAFIKPTDNDFVVDLHNVV